MRLFGFDIKRSDKTEKMETTDIIRNVNEEGALEVNTPYADFNNFNVDLLAGSSNETNLITRYRTMALDMDVKSGIDEVVNEMISVDESEDVVKIITDDVPFHENIRKKIAEEFSNILTLLDFSNKAYDIARNFYVDGRLRYHVVIDKNNPKLGIVKLKYMDPRKVRLVREYDERKMDPTTGSTIQTLKREYYVYHQSAFVANDQIWQSVSSSNVAIRLSKDSVVNVTSGITNENNTIVLSWLHPAIRPFNQLKMLEDCILIYRIVRAPERKVFYIDVGNMSPTKSQQYIQEMMDRHKNKMSYDSTSGDVRSDKNILSMTYDYWFARREGKGTQVDVLPGGQGLGELEDLVYFQKKLYRSLQVPVSRLESETMFNMGRPTEISREEIKFAKFIKRLRARFTILFDEVLYRQLTLKNIITPEQWPEIKDAIRYDFVRDNYFEELKQMEVLRERMNILRDVEDLAVGKYYSKAWVRKNILSMDEQEALEMSKQIEAERKEEEEEMESDGVDTDDDSSQPPRPNPFQPAKAIPVNRMKDDVSED